MKNRASAFSLRVAALAVCTTILLPLAALARQGNEPNAAIPTLDGAGLASLAGALSIAGAWLLSRNRNRRK